MRSGTTPVALGIDRVNVHFDPQQQLYAGVGEGAHFLADAVDVGDVGGLHHMLADTEVCEAELGGACDDAWDGSFIVGVAAVDGVVVEVVVGDEEGFR